jgi:uncharacterized protein YjeT (DUF2065 family)
LRESASRSRCYRPHGFLPDRPVCRGYDRRGLAHEPCLRIGFPLHQHRGNFVEKLTALFFLVTGLSHIVQPRVWIRFFTMLREKQEVGSLLNGLVHFPLGAFIVAFHNVWHGIPMIVTVIGWGLVIKSTMYFTYPRHGLRMLSTVSLERSWQFVVAGVISVALAGLILYPIR